MKRPAAVPLPHEPDSRLMRRTMADAPPLVIVAPSAYAVEPAVNARVKPRGTADQPVAVLL